MGQDYQDRREHARIDVRQAIYIEVVGRGSKTEADNLIIRCETVDISIGGLRIWIPTEIHSGARLNIAVPDTDWIENLELTGEARWVRPAEDRDGYWVGLELADSSREDMARWFVIVKKLSRQDS